MATTIKIRCNGAGRHVNEVNLDTLLQRAPVYRSGQQGAASASDIPDYFSLPCSQCTDGKVVVTRAVIEQVRSR